ncbi:CBS domain-containing protein [Bacillus tianshenii]|nr:CBS domain-containing protein [Bacillus tianshenii]
MAVLQDIMTKDCAHAEPKDDLYTLAAKMKTHDVGFLPIIEKNELKGTLTDRDLVVKGLAKENSQNEIHAASIMTEKVITGFPNMEVEEASRLMQEHQIQRLPVVENGELKGIASIGDMATSKHADQSAGNALSEIKK